MFVEPVQPNEFKGHRLEKGKKNNLCTVKNIVCCALLNKLQMCTTHPFLCGLGIATSTTVFTVHCEACNIDNHMAAYIM
jgi:hypothetical protein